MKESEVEEKWHEPESITINDPIIDLMTEEMVRIQDNHGRMYFVDSAYQLYRAIPLKGTRKRK